MHVRVRDAKCINVQLNRPITMCIAQFNLHLVVLVVAILPITRPAIASHNLARFNPWINPGIPGLSKLNAEIPGLAKRSGIAFPRSNPVGGSTMLPIPTVC